MKWQGAMMESHMDRREMNPKDRWLPQTARDSVNRASWRALEKAGGLGVEP